MPNQDDARVPASSGLLMSPLSIAVFLLASIIAAFYEQTGLSIFFGFVFTLTLSSHMWGRFSVHKLNYCVNAPAGGIFPGQTISITRTLHNQKLLPLVWVEVIEPCNPHGCLVPPQRFIIKNPNAEAEPAPEDEYRCLYGFAMLKWYQSLSFTDEWTANRRGIHRIQAVTIRSGDGFGLYGRNKSVAFETARHFPVYPRLVDVSLEKILRDIWDTCSVSHGYLEDVTLLRSARGYLPSDPAKRINQRILARGGGLMVNQYEFVTPGSVLFVLDTTSFARRDPEHLETTLSILASLLVGLCRRGIQAGLALPSSAYFPETYLPPSSEEPCLLRMLELLAGVGPENTALPGSLPVASPELIGQAYYIAYSFNKALPLRLLSGFPEHKITLLLWNREDHAERSGFRAYSIQSFRRTS